MIHDKLLFDSSNLLLAYNEIADNSHRSNISRESVNRIESLSNILVRISTEVIPGTPVVRFVDRRGPNFIVRVRIATLPVFGGCFSSNQYASSVGASGKLINPTDLATPPTPHSDTAIFHPIH